MYAGLLYPLYIAQINKQNDFEFIIKSTIESLENNIVNLEVLQKKLDCDTIYINKLEPLFVTAYSSNTLYEFKKNLPTIYRMNDKWYYIAYIGFLLYHLHLINIDCSLLKWLTIPLNDMVEKLFTLSFEDIKTMCYKDALIYAFWYGCYNEVNQEVYSALKDKKYIIDFHNQKWMLGSMIYKEKILK